MARRRRRGRRRNTVSTSVESVFFNIMHSDSTGHATTGLAAGPVVKVVNESTVNRKITKPRGELDLTVKMAGLQNAEFIFMLIAWPEEANFPTVDEYDPFSDDDVAGNPAYQGGVAAPLLVRRFAFTLPEGAPSTVLGSPIRFAARAERLLKPGFSLRWALYSKGNVSAAYAFALQGTLRILN